MNDQTFPIIFGRRFINKISIHFDKVIITKNYIFDLTIPLKQISSIEKEWYGINILTTSGYSYPVPMLPATSRKVVDTLFPLIGA